MLEIEIKASLGDLEKEQIKNLAEIMNFKYSKTLHETDIYFNGNDRNFAKTDEALRLRSCEELYKKPHSEKPQKDTAAFITYKGPKLDEDSSTRTEYETSIGDLSTAKELLCALGYKALFTVEKIRDEFKLEEFKLCDDKNRIGEITLCIDEVSGLGNYIELETLADSEDNKEIFTEKLINILDELKIPRENMTRKSYLELLFIK